MLRNVHAMDLCKNKLDMSPPTSPHAISAELDISKQRTPVDFMPATDTPIRSKPERAAWAVIGMDLDVTYSAPVGC